MNPTKIIALSVLSVVTLLGVASSINALSAVSSDNLGSEIVFVDAQNDYEIYTSESDVGYLQVTVID